MSDLALRSTRVVTPDGLRAATVFVRDGRITSVDSMSAVPPGTTIVDCGTDVIMPGLVDTHVHVNEPGRTEWEGFVTATQAAAAGGVTTLLDMPLNSIPATTSVAALESKRQSAHGQCFVDVGFIAGVVPGNWTDIVPLHAAGVLGYKCFLVPSGVPEFGNVGEADLRMALPALRSVAATLMVHAELPGPIAAAPPIRESRKYAQYLASRPRASENDAIGQMIRLAEEFGVAVHIVHLSSSEALPALVAARARGVPISVETCPHYLQFAAEDIPDGATEYKCAPPIRESANREQLWRALTAGTIDMIVSDHSPCPPALKHRDAGDFARAWGGIASLQLGLSVVWSGMRARGMPLEQLATFMSTRPARLAGLLERKGAIAAGRDADFVVWRPEEEFVVESAHLLQRHPLTPYAGMRLPGVVQSTYLRGQQIFSNGRVRAEPSGVLLAPAHSSR